MKKQPEQITLPFTIEGNVANRSTVRELSKNADYMRKVDISLIRIRPDHFNARIKPEGMSEEAWDLVLMIPDLADKIHANGGPADPILGDFHMDGHFYQTNGERRIRAIRHIIKTGREVYPDGETLVSEVFVVLNPPGTTDLDRKKKMYHTNDNLPFTTMQKAYYFASFKDEPYNLTHEQIALEFKKSRQTIDNYVLATTLPKEVQEKIDNGEIKISNALGEYRKEKAESKKGIDDGIPILTEGEENRKKQEQKDNEKVRGDEDEFLQQDNSITSAGTRGGPSEGGSGAVVVGKDSIYMMEQKLALWKQALNRLGVIRADVASNLPANDSMGEVYTPEGLAIWIEKEVATRMMNEYNLTVK